MNPGSFHRNAANATSSYELLDFGEGRKLERFAGTVVDRPCPAAAGVAKHSPREWARAEFSFQLNPERGWSSPKGPADWRFSWSSISLQLRLSPFGHVGFFPEQVANWRWLDAIASTTGVSRPLSGLNLFGYTGGSSLAMAAAGYHVTHVDASKPTMRWARENAHMSSLASSAIRWLIDDVRGFAKRALKRAERYDVIIMDPPAYGHGVRGTAWELSRDLDDLIESTVKLLNDEALGFLLTGHSPIPSIETGPMSRATWAHLNARFSQSSRHRMTLSDSRGRRLDCGYAYRFWNASKVSRRQVAS